MEQIIGRRICRTKTNYEIIAYKDLDKSRAKSTNEYDSICMRCQCTEDQSCDKFDPHCGSIIGEICPYRDRDEYTYFEVRLRKIFRPVSHEMTDEEKEIIDIIL